MEHSFKWKKQYLLWNFGVRNYEEFSKNIKVFQSNEKNIVLDFVQSKELMLDSKIGFTMVAILVPIEHRFGLANIIMRKKQDVVRLRKALDADCPYGEIWICLNNESEKDYYSGRYCIDTSQGEERHFVEMIEGNYPRLLEKVRFNESDNGYCVLERTHWGTSYHGIMDSKLSNDFRWKQRKLILVNIERKRENIEDFCTCLHDQGINNICLEFKMERNQLSFIDWDTENDDYILELF